MTQTFLTTVLGVAVSACVLVSTAQAESPSFGRHVSPLLYKLGCSAGSCHGSFAGKGGLQLSLFASQPTLDFENLRYASFGRRVNLQDPAASLFLRKPTMAIPHGGGRVLRTDSHEYRVLFEWIAGGAKSDAEEPPIVGVRSSPAEVVLTSGQDAQHLQAYSLLGDGTEENVTDYARFESLDPSVAIVHADGRIEGQHAGDAPVLVHYCGHIGVTTVLIPREAIPGFDFPDENPSDQVDRLILAKLRRLNVLPSPICDDGTFLRRAFLDTVSVLPTPDEARAFLEDEDPEKRARLIDRLLDHPLHAAQWATKMCDLIGADNRYLDSTAFHDWFRNKIERNAGWDEIAYGILCATAADDRGLDEIRVEIEQKRAERRRRDEIEAAKKSGKEPPPGLVAELHAYVPTKPWNTGKGARKTLAELYDSPKFVNKVPDANGKKQRMINARQLALQTTHALLGVQLSCAQCHKHPSDKWTQKDFFGLAAVFAHVRLGVDPSLAASGVPLSGPWVADHQVETFCDPATGERVPPKALDGPVVEIAAGVDPRRNVWEWMTDESNPYFARGIVNRVWAHYVGRGFYEPVDAQAAANPPSHPGALEELVRDFVDHGFDFRRLERRILNTRTYQRSWHTNASNANDLRNFSHHPLRRLTAEQALDAVLTATGAKHELSSVYYSKIRDNGERIIEMGLSRFRGDDAHVLQAFGKPLRMEVCDCERGTAPDIGQSLYLLNDDRLDSRIAGSDGRIQRMLESGVGNRQTLDELHLICLSRLPSESEVDQAQKYLDASPSRVEGFCDILWSLLNRQEFIINR